MSKIINLKTEEQLEELTSNKNNLIVIDFHAKWCKPCKVFGKFYNEYVDSFTKSNNVSFCKLDIETDDLQDFCEENEIESIPCLMFLKGDNILEKYVGGNPSKFKSIMDKLV
jgi:thioredoxin 1